MRILKATICFPECHKGATKVFNLDQVLAIEPNPETNSASILLGPGMFKCVYLDSIEVHDLGYKELEAMLKRGCTP